MRWILPLVLLVQQGANHNEAAPVIKENAMKESRGKGVLG